MVHSLISTGLLEMISNRGAENAKRPGKPPFPDFQAHFHGHEDDLDCWTSRAARWRVEASSDEAPAVVSHPVKLTCRFASLATPTIPSRLSEDAPYEPADAMCSKVPSVDRAGIMPTAKPALH